MSVRASERERESESARERLNERKRARRRNYKRTKQKKKKNSPRKKVQVFLIQFSPLSPIFCMSVQVFRIVSYSSQGRRVRDVQIWKEIHCRQRSWEGEKKKKDSSRERVFELVTAFFAIPTRFFSEPPDFPCLQYYKLSWICWWMQTKKKIIIKK